MNGILSVNGPSVTVELLGLARHRAGRAEVIVRGETVGELLRAVVRLCSGLDGLIGPDGSISRHYLVSVDGDRFMDDPTERVAGGARLLILGADAGG